MPGATLTDSIRRVVIKLGTGILTSGVGRLNPERIASICGEVDRLMGRGIEVLLVSSGAVGLGIGRLGLDRRPERLPRLQMCAAVGQSVLIEHWQKGMEPYGRKVAQILVTRDDLRIRGRHVSLREALDAMLKEGVVPVINENDCISTDEIRFGDNDVLSALVASMSKADLLFILSTIPGLINPDDGQVVPVVREITPAIEAMASGTKSKTSVGGMVTKIEAAKVATRSGCGVFIGDGQQPDLVENLMGGTGTGTFFVPGKQTMTSKKRWMAFFDRPQGVLWVDAGAVRALVEGRGSLLAAGLIRVEGEFPESSIVNVVGPEGQVLARGKTLFSSAEIRQLAGKNSAAIRKSIGQTRRPEILHRDHLVLVENA